MPRTSSKPMRLAVETHERAIWCVDVVSLPAYVDDDSGPYRPDICLFVDATTGLVLPPQTHRHIDATSLAAAFEQAGQDARKMGIAAPAALHADSERVAELCRAALGDHLPIVVARSPALDELRHGLFDHIAGSGAPSYRLGRIGKPHLQAFFTAAATYRKHRPWDVFADADIPLALSIPAIDLVDAACCVITDDDMGGLAIYPDGAAFVQTLRTRAPDVHRQEVWVVAYYDKQQMPPTLAKELSRLSFAPRRGPHPALLTLDRDGVARPPSKADFLAATLALGAVAQFADELDADPDLDAKTIAIPVLDSVIEIELRWPHPALSTS